MESSSKQRWAEVDRYIADLLIPKDPAFDAALRVSTDAGLPPISVTAPQGKLLMLLARLRGARNILEIGTLGGYSTLWLARALPPGGRLITLEIEPEHARVARENIARAGLGNAVEVRLGPAEQTLSLLEREGRGPFDFIFIDADKPGYPAYFEWAMKLSRSGTLIVADNVVRNGAVTDATSDDPNVRGVRRLLELMATDPRVMATVVQMVGGKGYDGMALAFVT